MKTFVFIYGAHHGAWCWEKLIEILNKKNCKSYAPESNEANKIIEYINNNNLNNIILVGHSYAGLVIAQVNELIPEKISQLVFLDAFLPEDKKTGYDILDEKTREAWKRNALKFNNKIPASEKFLEMCGITDSNIRNYLLPRLTDFNIDALEKTIYLSEYYKNINKAYIYCKKPSYFHDLMSAYYDKAKKLYWKTYEINSDHEVMITHAEGLAKLLLGV